MIFEIKIKMAYHPRKSVAQREFKKRLAANPPKPRIPSRLEVFADFRRRVNLMEEMFSDNEKSILEKHGIIREHSGSLALHVAWLCVYQNDTTMISNGCFERLGVFCDA